MSRVTLSGPRITKVRQSRETTSVENFKMSDHILFACYRDLSFPKIWSRAVLKLHLMASLSSSGMSAMGMTMKTHLMDR